MKNLRFPESMLRFNAGRTEKISLPARKAEGNGDR
jgi:hypothetical protein